MSMILKRPPNQSFSIATKKKDGVVGTFYSNMSTGPLDIYEIKRSQRHLLAGIENAQFIAPIDLVEMIC